MNFGEGDGVGVAGSAEDSAGKAVFSFGATNAEAVPAPGWEKRSVAERKIGKVTLAAEVAEKSGAALSASRSGCGALTCARDTQTLASSRTADRHSLFIMLLSEGCPHA